MEISEVRVKLVSNKDDRLKAFCSITIDNEFVVRDIKVIEGTNGHFVAMPSRKMSDHCEKCGGKNHLRAKYCNNCGIALKEFRKKLYRPLKRNWKSQSSQVTNRSKWMSRMMMYLK
jgi:stage V sporulation protein G